MVGANSILGKLYETIDVDDPYYGYSHDTLKPFKFVKLVGDNFTKTQIQSGEQFEIRKANFAPGSVLGFEWSYEADTLVIRFIQKDQSEDREQAKRNRIYKQTPYLLVMAPALSGVFSEGIDNTISGWKGGTFEVTQVGYGMLLKDNLFDKLIVQTRGRGYVDIEDSNQIDAATIQVRDSSTCIIEKNIFKSFSMQVDSSAYINLPGSLLKKSLGL